MCHDISRAQDLNRAVEVGAGRDIALRQRVGRVNTNRYNTAGLVHQGTLVENNKRQGAEMVIDLWDILEVVFLQLGDGPVDKRSLERFGRRNCSVTASGIIFATCQGIDEIYSWRSSLVGSFNQCIYNLVYFSI